MQFFCSRFTIVFFKYYPYNTKVMINILRKFKKLFDPIDLTKGDIRKVFTLFLIPIILSLIFQQVYSLTDTIIVGKNLSANEIAGVNDAVPIACMVLNFSIGCTAGFSLVLSRSIGEKNLSKARKSVFVQLILAIFFSIILTLVAYFTLDLLLAWVKITPSETNESMQAIYTAAKDYLVIIFIGGIISQMLYNMVGAMLRALGDSFTPFLFLVFSCILNIGLDILFIVPLQMGVKGSAWATVLSQALAALGAFIYAFIRYKELRFRKEDLKTPFSFIYEHIRLGVPLGFQWSILFIGVVIMSAAVIPFDMIDSSNMVVGNPAQVGYGVANKLSGILMGFFSAVGTALLSFISQNKGAKEYDRIRKGFAFSFRLSIVLSLFCTAIGFLLTINGAYQYIFLSKESISAASIKYGNSYLYVALPFYIPLSFIYIGRNTVQALEKPLFPFFSGVVELLARTIVCLFLPSLINHGPIDSYASFVSYISVCFADPITWILSAIVVIIPSFVYLNKMKKGLYQEKDLAKSNN